MRILRISYLVQKPIHATNLTVVGPLLTFGTCSAYTTISNISSLTKKINQQNNMLTGFNLDSHDQGPKYETRSQTFEGH